MRPLNRPWQTKNYPGAEHFKTYRISAPTRTHRRRATCAEVDCPKRARGYRAQFDVSTVQGRANAQAVESSGKKRTFEVAGPMVTYTFPSGQDCFDVHTVTLEREPLYIVQGGDHRGNPRSVGRVTHSSAQAWVDDFGEHQLGVAQRVQRG